MGRAQFDKPVNLRAQDLTIVNSKISQVPVESAEFLNADQTGNVASGGSEETIIQPPAGYIYEVYQGKFQTNSDADATSGTHYMAVKTESALVYLLVGESGYSSNVTYSYNEWVTADSLKRPADGAAQAQAIKGQRIDENNGLIVRYQNDTDAAQENDRTIRLAVRKIKVA